MGERVGWKYTKLDSACALESAIWVGSDQITTRTHFHDEIQLTAVTFGSRGFRVGKRTISVRAGQFVLIPPGIPHMALCFDARSTRSFNLYLRGAILAAKSPIVLPLKREVKTAEEICEDMPELIATAGLAFDMNPVDDRLSNLSYGSLVEDGMTVARIAAGINRSREGFTRTFAKSAGMPPHSFRLVARLNKARALLRSGESIALVAAETGFADQSHLGRHFRRVFGISPGAYRKG